MQANAEAKALSLLDVGVPHSNVGLRLDSTFDRIDDACKFREKRIARGVTTRPPRAAI
jgi:hypothetical protein